MSDTIGTAQIAITGDASGFDASVKQAKKSLADLGANANKAGKDAASGMTAAEGSSKKLEAATKRTAATIERQALAMGRTKSEYYAAKAAIDGNAKALEPYIAKLREAEKNAASMAQAQKGIAETSIATSKAFGAIAATLSVAKFIQMADSVTALNNQLKLATGSTTAAAAAYESLYEISLRSGSGLIALGDTYAAIARAGASLGISQNRLLTVTEAISNAMKISGGSAASMQAALVQLSQGLASGTLRGEELNSVMEQTPRLAQALADGMGITRDKLREMGAEGAITAERVIKALESQSVALQKEVRDSVLTVGSAFTSLETAALNFVKNADKATGASGALAYALKKASEALDGVGKAVNDNGTLIASTMGALAGAATIAGLASLYSGLGKVAVGIKAISLALAANPATLALLGIGAAVGGFVAYNSAQSKTVEGMRRTLKELETLNRDAVNSPYYTGASDTATNKLIEERKKQIDTLRLAVAEMDAQNLDTRGEDARLARYAQAAKASQSLSDSLTEATQRNAGLTKAMGQYYADLEIYQKAREAGKITEQEYVKLVSDLAVQYGEKSKKVKENKDAEKELNAERKRSFDVIAERNKLVEQASKQEAAYQAALQERNFDAAFDAQEKARLATEEQIKTGREYLEQIEFETRLIDMNTEQRAIATAVRELESKGIAAGTKAYDAYINKIKEAIKLRDGKTVAAEQAKEAADEWKKTAERIEQDLTDALMRGFESGKDFAKNLRDTLVNMFKTLVLRPIISAVVNPVAGAITGSLGLSGAANAATGGVSALGGLGGLGGTIGALGTGLGAGAGMIAGGGIGGWLGASTSLIGTGTAAGAMAGIGALAGPIGAALAVVSLLKSLDDSGTLHTGGLGSYSAAGGIAVGDAVKDQGLSFNLSNESYQASTQQASTQMAQAIVGLLDSTAATFGKEAGYWAATGFADDTSKDGAWGALAIKMGDTLLADWKNGADKWPGREFADGEAGAREYAADVALDVRNLLIEQTPEWADTMLNALGDAPTIEALAGVVAQINTAAAALDGMGRASQQFAALTDEATSALITALGGAEAAVANLSGYYANFYSETERTGIATAQLTEQLATLGVELPASREAFRAMVDAALEAGNPALAGALVALSDEFAALVPVTEAVADAVVDTTAALARAAKDARSAALAQLDASVQRERTLWEQQATAAASLRDEVRGLFDLLSTNIQELRSEAIGPALSAAQGNQFITQALAGVSAGVGLPDATDLGSAISAARSGLGLENFASSAEQQFATLKLAGELAVLQEAAGDQLSTAELQLAAANDQIEQLDQTLTSWRTQLDDNKTAIDATLSVASAVDALRALMAPSQSAAAAAAATTTGAAGQGGFVVGGGSGGATPGRENYGNLNDVQTVFAGSYARSLEWGTPEADAASTATLAAYAQANSISQADLADVLGFTPEQVRDHFERYGIPAFDQGINLVPYDMTARIHKGEAVVPAVFNPFNPAAPGGGNAEVVAELRAMRSENATLRALFADMALHTQRTAEATNGRPDRPMPVETV